MTTTTSAIKMNNNDNKQIMTGDNSMNDIDPSLDLSSLLAKSTSSSLSSTSPSSSSSIITSLSSNLIMNANNIQCDK
eukprot:UN10568